MRIMVFLAAFLCSAVLPAASQLRLRSAETLPLSRDHSWAMPQWSADGSRIYFTTSGLRGVWEYTLASRSTRVIAADVETGHGFSVAPDGAVTRPSSAETAAPASFLERLGGGDRYIWPALSPDGKRLVAYDMERGSLVVDLDGGRPVQLGRRDAAVWTRDGRWLIYMHDVDDGHVITGSEIAFVAPDGSKSGTLTSTPGMTEMYPRCSPADNAIVCTTLEGEIVILRYEEEAR